MPDKTLLAFADHGQVAAPMATDGGDAEAVIAEIAGHGVDIDALATQLQQEGGASFAKSWGALLGGLRDKTAQLAGAHSA
jgi:transaldolase